MRELDERLDAELRLLAAPELVEAVGAEAGADHEALDLLLVPIVDQEGHDGDLVEALLDRLVDALGADGLPAARAAQVVIPVDRAHAEEHHVARSPAVLAVGQAFDEGPAHLAEVVAAAEQAREQHTADLVELPLGEHVGHVAPMILIIEHRNCQQVALGKVDPGVLGELSQLHVVFLRTGSPVADPWFFQGRVGAKIPRKALLIPLYVLKSDAAFNHKFARASTTLDKFTLFPYTLPTIRSHD